jgi:hypothetical protein
LEARSGTQKAHLVRYLAAFGGTELYAKSVDIGSAADGLGQLQLTQGSDHFARSCRCTLNEQIEQIAVAE